MGINIVPTFFRLVSRQHSTHTQASLNMSTTSFYTFTHAQFFATGVAFDAEKEHNEGLINQVPLLQHLQTNYPRAARDIFFGMLDELGASGITAIDYVEGHIPPHLENAPFLTFLEGGSHSGPASHPPALTFDRAQFFAAGMAFDEVIANPEGHTQLADAETIFFTLMNMLDQIQAKYVNPTDFVHGYVPPHLENAPFLNMLPAPMPDLSPVEALYSDEYASDDQFERENWEEKCTAILNQLTVTDVADICSERCPHCWCDFSEEVEGIDTTPVKTPCGHLFMRGCLLESFKAAEHVRCPMCRQDIEVLLATGASSTAQ